MAAVGGRLVAVGEGEAHSPVAWGSTDGRSWLRQEFECGEECTETGFHRLWELPNAVLVLGAYDVDGDNDRIDVEALWHSPDGFDWSQVLIDDDFDQSVAIAFGLEETCGFVGVEAGNEEEGDEAWHVMHQGATGWEEAGTEAGLFDLGHLGSLDDTAVFRGRIVLAGSDINGTTIWTSADGRSWERQDLAVAGLNPSLAVVDETLVMHTTVAGEAYLWTSKDGRTWSGEATGLQDEFEIARWNGGVLGIPRASGGGVWFSSDLTSWVQVGP